MKNQLKEVNEFKIFFEKNLKIKSTKDIKISENLIDQVVGHEKEINLIKLAIIQKRSILLVGVPGIGKSLIARALIEIVEKPKQEVYSFKNEKKIYNPKIIIVNYTEEELKNIRKREKYEKRIHFSELDREILEFFNFFCNKCKVSFSLKLKICPFCGHSRVENKKNFNPFNESYKKIFGKFYVEEKKQQIKKNYFPRKNYDPIEKKESFELYILDRNGEEIIKLTKGYSKKKYYEWNNEFFNLLSLERKTFLETIGNSEVELLGDISHSAFGETGKLSIPAHKRIILGRIHEAHEGILYVDELINLIPFQEKFLTSFQDKFFSISATNPMSSGASVRTEKIPCNFLFIASLNFKGLERLSPPLRSRFRAEGYEFVLNPYMEINQKNILKFIKFISQEIIKDGKIPHMNLEAIKFLIKFNIHLAEKEGKFNSFSLRLRKFVGYIKFSGDLAKLRKKKIIGLKEIKEAILRKKDLENQIKFNYGSLEKAKEFEKYFDQEEEIEKEEIEKIY